MDDKQRAPAGGPPHRTGGSNDEGIPDFAAKELPAEPTGTAPDGPRVRELVSLASGSAAHFELPPGAVSRAGRHRTVDEIWYILEGRGEMWRSDGKLEDVVPLKPGIWGRVR